MLRFSFQSARRPRVSLVFARLTCAAIFRLRLLCSSFDGSILSDTRIKANRVLRFCVAFAPVFRLYRRFCLAKIAKTRKTRNFSRFREKVAQKTSGLFVHFDGWTVPRRAYTLYIYKRACHVQRLLLKFFNVFPYAIIISNLCVFVKYLRSRLFFRI